MRVDIDTLYILTHNVCYNIVLRGELEKVILAAGKCVIGSSPRLLVLTYLFVFGVFRADNIEPSLSFDDAASVTHNFHG